MRLTYTVTVSEPTNSDDAEQFVTLLDSEGVRIAAENITNSTEEIDQWVKWQVYRSRPDIPFLAERRDVFENSAMNVYEYEFEIG